jgi:hypothetical protein
VMSGILKRCPVCRVGSRFISPSTHFFPQDHPRKQGVMESYKNSMARVPCKSVLLPHIPLIGLMTIIRYFVKTLASGRPCCPFGADCFYQHVNLDGTPHSFQYGADHFMKVCHPPHPARVCSHLLSDIQEAATAAWPRLFRSCFRNGACRAPCNSAGHHWGPHE